MVLTSRRREKSRSSAHLGLDCFCCFISSMSTSSCVSLRLKNGSCGDSASLGAMEYLIWKLDELMQDEDWKSLLQKFRNDVGSICTKLEKLSEVPDAPFTVNYWMKDVRELSYEMADFFNGLVHARDAQAKIDDVLEFEARMEDATERYDCYDLENYRNHDSNTEVSHRLGSVYVENGHVDMDDRVKELRTLRSLVEPNSDEKEDRQLKVVSILGEEGVGKSMLAKKLWHGLETEFKTCRAFVQMAKMPDMRMILISILSQVCPHQPPEDFTVPNLIHDIWKYLQDERYFIVIDDLWAVSIWDIVRRAFPDGNNCSRIIIITTVKDVAQACCTNAHKNIVKIERLGGNQPNKLFVGRISGSGKEYPQELIDITGKCGGLPLAIVCIATLVASQQETKQQLDYVKKFLDDNLRTNPTSVEILNQVLKLCYSSLPDRLRTCLLYLSMYPENYVILKEDLVKQWISEGFVYTTEGKDIEVASSYFDDLVSLGLIQRLDIDCNPKKGLFAKKYPNKGWSYVVHPTVFDFVTSKSIEDNFITIIDYSQSTVILTEKIRRLSLHFGSATYASTPASIELSQIRSLAFMGLLGCMPSLVKFKIVRVAILHIWADNGDTKFPLADIRELLLLRYLQVRCNVAVELPDKVQCLKHLETLEISAEVATVPWDILHHPSLVHVHLGTKTKHKHLTLDRPVVTSEKAIFPDGLGTAPSHAIQVFQLLPPLCSFSRLPAWIQKLRKLRILKAVIRELWAHDVDHLARLPELTVLSLHVRIPIAGRVVTFRKETFLALEYLKLVSGELWLNFWEEALPNLRTLKICFNVHRGKKYGNMLRGIKHLLNLQEVAASIGVAEGSDIVAAESALRDAICQHPSCPRFDMVKRVDPVDEEYDHPPPSTEENANHEIQVVQPSNERDEAAGMKQPIPPGSGTSTQESPPVHKDLAERSSLGLQWLAASRQSQNMVRRRRRTAGPTGIVVDRLLGKVKALLHRRDNVLFSGISGANMRPLLRELNLTLLEMRYELTDYDFEYETKWVNFFSETVDWIDLFNLRIADDLKPPSSRIARWLHRTKDVFNTLSAHRAISKELLDFRARFHKLRDDCQRFAASERERAAPPKLLMPVGKHEFADDGAHVGSLVGLEGPTEDVCKMCMNPDSDRNGRPNIICIVGMPGSGKTTLAWTVYQRLRQDFDSGAIISVGQVLDMLEALRSMLPQLEIQHKAGEYTTQLTLKLRESLQEKRYLIVVDDLWNLKHWIDINDCFPANNRHSTVIITTRNDALALHCSYSSNCIYKIGLLRDADSKQLFLNKVFGTPTDRPQHLEEFFGQIMRKCAGLPLAIVSAAAMLAHNKSKDEWERLGFNFLSASDMKQKLNLSYNDLPPNLKMCMLYLSIYPECYELDVECLVRLWIAEGFVVQEEGIDLLEAARSYLDELISTNMVLPLHVNHDGFPKYCKVHPVIHAFIVHKSTDENLVAIVTGPHQDVPTNYGAIRRLSVQSSSKKNQTVVQKGSMDLSRLHSIIVFGQATIPPRPTDLRVLRVLYLEGCHDSIWLDGLHELRLLRYLCLRGTDVNVVPEAIGELMYLETLDVRSTNVKELPDSIVRLKNLTHLLCGSAKLPRGVWRMEALQTLSCECSNDILFELRKLVKLREVQLFCDFTQMPRGTQRVTFRGSEFHLRKLSIRCKAASVTFEQYVLMWVEVLELSFDGLPVDKSSGVSGIGHLWGLKHVLLEFSQQDAGTMATVDAVREAAAVHPNHPEVTVYVDGRYLD